MSMTISKAFLLLSISWAVYVLWIVSYQNGLLTAARDIQKPGGNLPGSELVPARHRYTGVGVLDKQIKIMTGFFWPALDGSRADVSLVFLEITTQVIATWILLTIESLRVGNKGKWYITSVTITGVLMQNLGYGLIVPLWLFLHLTASSTINAATAAPLISSNPLAILTLPLSTILAFFLPNLLMSLSPPHRFSPDNSTKQLYVAICQFGPVLMSVSQFILPIAISATTPGINILSERDKKLKSLKYLRRSYIFAFASTTLSHCVAVGIPLLAYLFPKLFSPVYLPQLQLPNVFVPKSPLPPVQPIPTFVDGVLAFTQWDLLIGSLAVLVWAVTLALQAQRTRHWAFEWLESLLKVAALVCVSGPVGAAVVIIWERDEMVFGLDLRREEEERKSR
ncbi:hypothetical protein GJ744_002173 [Endocarpon pusillum]|uniref:Uncharacterized protein n=1 Tax=Endocarpon pusillum TaxID=364733 RepID=A0A8H7E1C8_9EURO|nr:hypothetical protein GJ744_002173 [Endocarpon pusillum]